MVSMFPSRSVRSAVAVAALAGSLVALMPGEASAQYYRRRGPDAGAVAAGVVGGLALGALAAGAARPAPYYYGPGPTYVYEDVPPPPPPRCWYEREDVWNGYAYVPRRIRVCQ